MLSYFFFKVTSSSSKDSGLSADEEQYGNGNTTYPLSPRTFLFTILRYTLLSWNTNMELASDCFPAVIDIDTKIPTYDWMCSDKQKCLNIKVQMWLCKNKCEWLQPTPSWKSQAQRDKTWWSTQFHWLGLQRECNWSEDSISNFSLWDSFRQERNLPLLHRKNHKMRQFIHSRICLWPLVCLSTNTSPSFKQLTPCCYCAEDGFLIDVWRDELVLLLSF